MEKLIPNSDSTSKKSVEKRQVWVKESFGKKKKIYIYIYIFKDWSKRQER